MRRRTLLSAGVASAASAALPRVSVSQPANARVLTYVPQANLTVLDPVVTTANVTSTHGWMVFDTLYGLNAAQQPKPQMAAGHTVSDDGRTWLIQLRDGLFWHDGERVLARDCARSLGRWAARDTFGQTLEQSVEAWEAQDDRTIRIRLKRPFPLLPDALAKSDAQCAFMMPERIAATDPFKPVTEIIGSGPFRFVPDEFVAGSNISYARFDRYHPREEPPDWSTGGKVARFERVHWKVIPDAATAGAALQKGEVDWYEQVLADLVPMLRNDRDITIAPSNPQGYMGGLRFNHLHPPFNDVRLRRAVMTAVNQDDYMQAVTGNDRSAYKICKSQFPNGTPYFDETSGRRVMIGDLDKARAMVRAAGYDGAKAVVINPTDFPTVGPFGDVTFDLLRKIGINAEMAATDWGSVVQRRASKEPVEKGGWSIFHTWFSGGFVANPISTAPFRGQGEAGWFGWYSNPAVEQLTRQFLDAPDAPARKAIADRIEEENFTQVPSIPLGVFDIRTAYRSSLKNRVQFVGPVFWGVSRG